MLCLDPRKFQRYKMKGKIKGKETNITFFFYLGLCLEILEGKSNIFYIYPFHNFNKIFFFYFIFFKNIIINIHILLEKCIIIFSLIFLINFQVPLELKKKQKRKKIEKWNENKKNMFNKFIFIYSLYYTWINKFNNIEPFEEFLLYLIFFNNFYR